MAAKIKQKKGVVKLSIPFVVEAPVDQIVQAFDVAYDSIMLAVKVPKRVKVEGAKVTVLD